MRLLTAAQMRAIEQDAMARGRVSGLELMERAGRGVVDAVFDTWPEFARPRQVERDSLEYLAQEEARKAVVLCGPGNNGGDGFVIARALVEQGWAVEVYLYGDPETLPPDARSNYDRWSGPVHDGSEALRGDAGAADLAADPAADLIVDALFGTGLSRGLSFDPGLARALPDRSVERMPDAPRVVAVDLPSGLCSDSGRRLEGEALWADLTVTFHAQKLGHVLSEGPSACGRVAVVDIGLPSPDVLADPGRMALGPEDPACPGYALVDPPVGLGKGISPFGSVQKYSFGHALILAGGFGKTGAARLAARGALRVGAGLVTLGPPGAAQMEVACQITAAMMRRVEDAGSLAEVLGDGRINALCLGPGLGLERARALMPVALGGGGVEPRPTVLDADALTAFAEAPEALFEMLHSDCVLTPHGGEFARLFPDLADRLVAPAKRGPAYSKVDATRDAAARAGCVVLYKGPDTVIADPSGQVSVHAAVYDRAAPWLATAGSGDVLAGIITGLLARRVAPSAAAAAGAWLHVEAARSFGPGLVAEDLPEALPAVFRALDLV